MKDKDFFQINFQTSETAHLMQLLHSIVAQQNTGPCTFTKTKVELISNMVEIITWFRALNCRIVWFTKQYNFNHWLFCDFSWWAFIFCEDLIYRWFMNIFVQAPRLLGMMWAALSPFSILYLRNLAAKLARLGWWIAYFYNFMALALTCPWLDCGYERKHVLERIHLDLLLMDLSSVHPLGALF